ncbi:MAG: hypothetical protein QF568_04140 [Flavobacteriales bacterium]|jgi:hypothetical protein|nr:hypothetical protein [Flavobacteriales bacterium]|tara:strand:+ start:675 stop:1157 length:483 start_codon:yes stop_codon:yes gene_type:complete
MYQNPFAAGYEVLSKSGYSMDSHGSLSNTASYLITNDLPDYAAMFYSPIEHENITSIKYGNFEQDYSNLREIQQSLNGPPIEFYIPHSFDSGDGVGKQNELQIIPENLRDNMIDRLHKEAVKEIENAQRQVKGKRIKSIEVEDVLLLRKRKRTIVFEDIR